VVPAASWPDQGGRTAVPMNKIETALVNSFPRRALQSW
jgi:hypothetical protein